MKLKTLVRGGLVSSAAALAALGVGSENTVRAQSAAPTPLALAAQIDLKCYKTDSPLVPNRPVRIRHLNPVLRDKGLTFEDVVIRDLQQTCVPVEKNGATPGPLTLPIARHVDLACYRVDTQTHNEVPLNLTHLNPVLRNLNVPDEHVILGDAKQLCVPVAKNGVLPPPEVLHIVRHIDLACYEVNPGPDWNLPLVLRHLNPQLANLPVENNIVKDRRQLCVPVAKDDQPVPPGVLEYVQWIDLEKYEIQAPPLPVPRFLTLRQLNPLFESWPWTPVVLNQAVTLALPVAKDGHIPPNE